MIRLTSRDLVAPRRLTVVTTGEIVVRDAESTDITACALLISHHLLDDLEEWKSRFERDLANPQRQFLVATVDHSVVGYGHTTFHPGQVEDEIESGPTGYFLSGLLVSPAHRRRGLGRLLTTARIDGLRQMTDVVYYRADPDNQATIDLHARLGFKEIGSVVRGGKAFTLFSLEFHSVNRR